jgi:hypothetical protein
LFRLPFGVSMITCKAPDLSSNGANSTGFARPPGFFFLAIVISLRNQKFR